jgi:hypothetical protein
MGDEWGPWIEHDGKGRPVPRGAVVHMVARCVVTGTIEQQVGVAHEDRGSWDWSDPAGLMKIISYRVRKPRALSMLQEIAAGVREPVDA